MMPRFASFTSAGRLQRVVLAASVFLCAPVTAAAQTSAPDVVVHVAELTGGLYELESWKDPTSPGGKMLGVTNRGDELDPPPENDPNATFTMRVQGGVPYRLWVRMKVGAPMGRSTANLLFAQFSGAVDAAGKDVLKPQSADYIRLQGPARQGWSWVGSDRMVQFKSSGDVTVRVQFGAEGTGFDQIVLSPSRFLKTPPAEAIVAKVR